MSDHIGDGPAAWRAAERLSGSPIGVTIAPRCVLTGADQATALTELHTNPQRHQIESAADFERLAGAVLGETCSAEDERTVYYALENIRHAQAWRISRRQRPARPELNIIRVRAGAVIAIRP